MLIDLGREIPECLFVPDRVETVPELDQPLGVIDEPEGEGSSELVAQRGNDGRLAPSSRQDIAGLKVVTVRDMGQPRAVGLVAAHPRHARARGRHACRVCYPESMTRALSDSLPLDSDALGPPPKPITRGEGA